MSSMSCLSTPMSPNPEHQLLALVLPGLGVVPAQGPVPAPVQGQDACVCEAECQSPLLALGGGGIRQNVIWQEFSHGPSMYALSLYDFCWE